MVSMRDNGLWMGIGVLGCGLATMFVAFMVATMVAANVSISSSGGESSLAYAMVAGGTIVGLPAGIYAAHRAWQSYQHRAVLMLGVFGWLLTLWSVGVMLGPVRR